MAQQIQFRRGTAAEWTAANPTLAQGEMAVEYDTGKFKVGDGIKNWNTLGYMPLSYTTRSDVVDSYFYVGRAISGTPESSVGWSIKRSLQASNGSLTETKTASGKWDDRTTLTYA